LTFSEKFGYILARMRYAIILTPEAENTLKHLAARDRSTICEAIKTPFARNSATGNC
jgi:mRNA-degrading endonuclease RelE of RelBE toxin-antitoxin system